MAGPCLLLRELQGPLNPSKDEEEEDCAQEDEEDQDSEFVDAEELCSGGIKAGSLPGRLRGERPPAGPVLQGSFVFHCSMLGASRGCQVDLWHGCFVILNMK